MVFGSSPLGRVFFITACAAILVSIAFAAPAGCLSPYVVLLALAMGAVVATVTTVLIRRYWTRPLLRLASAVRDSAISQKPLPEVPRGPEFSALVDSYSDVLKYLTDVKIERLDEQRQLIWTQKELALKGKLEEKSRMLQATNQQLETRLRELSVLFSVSRAVGSSLELRPMLNAFTDASRQLLEVDRFALAVLDERRRLLVVEATFGFLNDAGLVDGMTVQPGEGLVGMAYERRSPIHVPDLEHDQRFLQFRGACRMSGSAMVLPLLAGHQCVGAWFLQRDPPKSFSFDDTGLFHVLANQVAGAIENALLYHKTKELATHDELTGLYNRRSLEHRLDMEWERCQRFGTTLGFLMIDVDHFKAFNDRHGHQVGDRVLQHVAGLVASSIRKVDAAARYGGEEFSVILPRTGAQEARDVAESIRARVENTPLVCGEGEPFRVTVSIGSATTDLVDGDRTSLVSMADDALYRAKESGRNRVAAAGLDR